MRPLPNGRGFFVSLKGKRRQDEKTVQTKNLYHLSGIMEITISRERILRLASILFLLSALIAGSLWAKSQGFLDYLFTLDGRSSTPGPEVPAMQAVETFYSPNLDIGQENWEEKVCTNMTPDGCLLFRQFYAPTIWDSAQSGKVPSDISIDFIDIAEKVKDGSQVWKLRITSKLTSAVIYIHVVKDLATPRWLLERVMFSQEAEARYGK